MAPDAIPRIVLLGRLSVYGSRAARLHEEIVPVTARWSEPGRRKGKLVPYGRTGEETTLASLQTALDEEESVPIQVQQRLAASSRTDIGDLLPHLQNRATFLFQRAKEQLAERAEAESRSMRALLERQRDRIARAAGADEDAQMMLALELPEEQRQREADRRAWQKRLNEIENELEEEPKRIANVYTVRVRRVDPIGLVYLWPRTG